MQDTGCQIPDAGYRFVWRGHLRCRDHQGAAGKLNGSPPNPKSICKNSRPEGDSLVSRERDSLVSREGDSLVSRVFSPSAEVSDSGCSGAFEEDEKTVRPQTSGQKG